MEQYIGWVDPDVLHDLVSIHAARVPEVPEPRFVRFGWKDVLLINLYNSADLPASPFSSEELLPGTN